jgi:2-iminobutanoate/2-iminopropanoate deaminase
MTTIRRAINPASVPAPLARYSHGLLVAEPGDLLVTSGQLGIEPDGAVPEDPEAQCVLIFESLRAILTEAGMSFTDVVRFNAFVTDRSLFPILGGVRGRYVAGDAFTSTLVIVSGFTRPEFKVEIEVTAVRGR